MLCRWVDDDRPRTHGLTAESFAVPEYAAIMAVAVRLERQGGQPADLQAELAGDPLYGQVRKAIGASIDHAVGEPADLARKLREINARLGARDRAAELSELALDLTVSPAQLVAWHAAQSAALRRFTTTGTSRFGLAEGVDVKTDLSTPELIRGLLPGNGKALLFGASNTGKSFAAVDMACRVALGLDWHGRRTEAGAVLYLASENANSIRRRISGWAIRHGVPIPDDMIVATRPGSLLDAGNMAALLDECRQIRSRKGIPIRLIVIDTLAMMMPGGDENSAEDMGRAIAACDDLAAVTGGMVVVVHHAGKDEARGARGWSGLKASMDVEIEATEGKLFLTKSRDGVRHTEFTYTMETVEIGSNAYNETVTTLVPVHGETVQHKGARTERRPRPRRELAPAAKIALDALNSVVAREGRIQPDSSLPPTVPSGVLTVRQSRWKEQFDRGQPEGVSSATHYKQWVRGIEYLRAMNVRLKDGWAWIEKPRGDGDV